MEKMKEDNSKARILEAATHLFAKNGFDGTSIREICKAAGTQKNFQRAWNRIAWRPQHEDCRWIDNRDDKAL